MCRPGYIGISRYWIVAALEAMQYWERCALGAVQRALQTPLRTDARSVSGLREIIAPTLVGLNLFLASSGKTPRWMKKLRMESSPALPVPRDLPARRLRGREARQPAPA